MPRSSADEQARLDDALASLDASLASFGVVLQMAGPGLLAAADIHIHLAATSSIGGAAEGVLGVTHWQRNHPDRYWNEYTGANAKAIDANQYDFQTVATHELGHAIGLGHSTDASSVMYASLSPGQARRGLTGADLTALAKAQGSRFGVAHESFRPKASARLQLPRLWRGVAPPPRVPSRRGGSRAGQSGVGGAGAALGGYRQHACPFRMPSGPAGFG